MICCAPYSGRVFMTSVGMVIAAVVIEIFPDINCSQPKGLRPSLSQHFSMSAITSKATQTQQVRASDQGRVLLVTNQTGDTAYSEELVRAGFTVVSVDSAAAALLALQRTRPHVIITDMNLSGITATELARMLTQAQDGMLLIFVGDEDATAARRGAAQSAGAFGYFQVPDEIEMMLARTAQLIAIKQTMDRLHAEVDRDYLTGLANRRRFRTAIGQEVERWRRYSVPCALLLVDIDHLKLINDAHGHSAGDMVIRHTARALTELSRDNDTAARLGGEEFALLLAATSDVQALAVAERLRSAVSSTMVETIGTVTVSIGVASCPSHADSERSLYAASDAALYCAKREGRNLTAVAVASGTGGGTASAALS